MSIAHTIHTPMKSKCLMRLLAFVSLALCPLAAQVPQIIHYQGRVTVNGANFTGSGQFKFALVHTTSHVTYWSNDGTGSGGSQPASAVTLAVAKGLYSVLLGDTSPPHNMTAIPNSVFTNSAVSLRVWFNDGINGFKLLTPDQRIAAVGYATIAGKAATVNDGAITSAKIANGAVGSNHLASNAIQQSHLASGAVGSAHLVSGAAVANLATSGLCGVAGGGVILSANPANPGLLNAGYVKLAETEVGDVWEQRSSAAAPSARGDSTVVWTGSEMIVWGGANGSSRYNDGGRFDPASNSWAAVTTTGAPTGRQSHTAVWTGNAMIIWGGYGGSILHASSKNDGGAYSPASNSWTAVTTTGAPTARNSHTAVWTNSEMIIWGGTAGITTYFNDGGRYNPSFNTWAAVISPVKPSARSDHTAVWTGSQMIVWGGKNNTGPFNDGGLYSPDNDTWISTANTGAPTARVNHTAVWTGSQMIVWGGYGDGTYWNDGGHYNPTTNSWTALSATGAPSARQWHTAVWSGNEMIVWGGYNGSSYFNDGGRYNPMTQSWARVPGTGAPSARRDHNAVWTGNAMIVWGGYNGTTYLNDTFSYSPSHTLSLYQRP